MVMSTRKVVPVSPTEKALAKELSPDEVIELPSEGLRKIEVTSLELDEKFDVDTDPYNRTGQFLVDALRLKDD